MAKRKITSKRKGFELQARTFSGKKSGKTYLVFKRLDGGYHVFVEAQATDAAADCGAKITGTRKGWDSLWKN